MSARDAILLSPGLGDRQARRLLRHARWYASNARRNPDLYACHSFALGQVCEGLNMAEVFMHADRDLVMAIRNEAQFLLGAHARTRS
jgi:hypothetical protein